MKMENQFWELEYSYDNYDECTENYCNYKSNKELHYDVEKKKWVKKEEYTGDYYPATFPCRSHRAAIRHLRKHNEIPRGAKFRLVSRYVGFDRIIIKR